MLLRHQVDLVGYDILIDQTMHNVYTDFAVKEGLLHTYICTDGSARC